ncbi:MAG: hypothetical protein AAF580_12960 [Pseudomonadota bacterium]
MVEVGGFHFRTFMDDVPRAFDRWRPVGDIVQWDRHYVVRDGYSLILTDESRIQIRQLSQLGPFRTEHLICAASFPLDWMALALIRKVLPITDPLLEIDGRTSEAFISSLDRPDLLQASLVKVIKRRVSGSASVEIVDFAIPGWNSLGVSVGLHTTSLSAMRANLKTLNFSEDQHTDYHTWIIKEAARVLPKREPIRRFGIPFSRAA